MMKVNVEGEGFGCTSGTTNSTATGTVTRTCGDHSIERASHARVRDNQGPAEPGERVGEEGLCGLIG